ncbi:MAG: Zn-ribbon domain-containing OB-fold protein [Candidatus Nezhaarchaeales archaeon]
MSAGFERFGRVSYTSESKAAEFIRFLEQGRVAATKCRKCGRLYFPPRVDCADCLSSDVEWVPLSGKCRLLTYTTVYFAPTGFESDLPYTLALAECEEGVKVFARVSKEVKEELKIGMELRLSPIRLPDGRLMYEYRKP